MTAGVGVGLRDVGAGEGERVIPTPAEGVADSSTSIVGVGVSAVTGLAGVAVTYTNTG